MPKRKPEPAASLATPKTGDFDLPPELTIRQAAELLGASARTVRRYMAEGSLIARNAAPLASSRPMWRIPVEAALAMRNDYSAQSQSETKTASARRVKAFAPRLLNWRPSSAR